MGVETLREADDGPRSKRAAILGAAVEHFGEVGFEATKWSEIAKHVGIGQTALYHYFESKAHCLLTVMRIGLHNSDEAFRAATADAPSAHEALRRAVRSAYEISDLEVRQNRILQANIALLVSERSSEREEAERLACRELVARIERNWTELLRQGMDSGEFARRDPQLLARTLLGTIVAVWRWYRPGGETGLEAICELVTHCCVRIVTP